MATFWRQVWGDSGPPTPSQQNSWTGDISRVRDWSDFYFNHCDGEFDGIWNNVDTESEVFSNSFSAPGPFGRTTDGTITQRGDREFKIKDAEVGGAHFEASPGSETAIIKLDGRFCTPQASTVFKPSANGTFGIATCLSSELSIEEGSADFTTSHEGIKVTAAVGSKQTVRYDIVDGKLRIETAGEGEISLIINDKPFILQTGESGFVHEVRIDNKPGSDPNPINCKNKGNGVIPVAILSAEHFDATTVDHTTVLFEGANETHRSGKNKEMTRHEEDVNGDGLTDLMFHFRQNETSLTCESTEAALTGRTFNGDFLIGTDSIDMLIR